MASRLRMTQVMPSQPLIDVFAGSDVTTACRCATKHVNVKHGAGNFSGWRDLNPRPVAAATVLQMQFIHFETWCGELLGLAGFEPTTS